MSAVIWSILVRDHYYLILPDGPLEFEFGIKIFKDYIVTWPLPEFIKKEVMSLTKLPWDFYKEFYQDIPPTKTYRVKENLELEEIGILPWMTIEAPEIPLMPVYVVLARRWGSDEGHTYPIGVSSTYEGALELGENEEHLRGGKYKAEIIRSYLESGTTETLKSG